MVIDYTADYTSQRNRLIARGIKYLQEGEFLKAEDFFSKAERLAQDPREKLKTLMLKANARHGFAKKQWSENSGRMGMQFQAALAISHYYSAYRASIISENPKVSLRTMQKIRDAMRNLLSDLPKSRNARNIAELAIVKHVLARENQIIREFISACIS
jgi:hypothetical protein